MFADTFRWNSKTFWVGMAMVVSGLVMKLFPEHAFVAEIISQFYGDFPAGTLIANGLGLVFVREAIAKNGVNK